MSTAGRKNCKQSTAYRDAEAFRAIVQRYGGMVVGTCLRILGNAGDAEHVARECFEILAAQDEIPRGPSLELWLHAVATWRAAMRRRNRRRDAPHEAARGMLQPKAGDDDSDAVYRNLDLAIAALPDQLQRPLIYRYFAGKSRRDTALLLGLPSSTVHTKLVRGIIGIAEILQDMGICASPVDVTETLCALSAKGDPISMSLTASLGRLALAQAGRLHGSSNRCFTHDDSSERAMCPCSKYQS